MLALLEQTTVWETIRDCPHPIAIYGMGDGAEKIVRVMAQYGRSPDAVFASDQYARGHSFLGHKVLTYSALCEQLKHFTVVLAFGIHDPPMLRRIYEMNQEHPVLAPDLPVTGDSLFTHSFAQAHIDQIEAVYHRLADERSRKVYLDILNYKISGKVEYLYSSFDTKSSVYSDILDLTDHESMLDLGAYDGDTIREFITAAGGRYRHIIAIEPDPKNFKKLVKNTAGMDRVTLLNMGIWDKPCTLRFHGKAGRGSCLSDTGTALSADCVDNLVCEPITYFKMDVEGAELAALQGAVQTIRRYRPKLYICAYHRSEDMFTLPETIWQICPDYKLYFRHSPYIPAWECNFYGVADAIQSC